MYPTSPHSEVIVSVKWDFMSMVFSVDIDEV